MITNTIDWDYIKGEQKIRVGIWKTLKLEDGSEVDLVLVSADGFDCRDYPFESMNPTYRSIYGHTEWAELIRCPHEVGLQLSRKLQADGERLEIPQTLIIASDSIKVGEELTLKTIKEDGSLGETWGDISYCICSRNDLWVFIKPRKQERQ